MSCRTGGLPEAASLSINNKSIKQEPKSRDDEVEHQPHASIPEPKTPERDETHRPTDTKPPAQNSTDGDGNIKPLAGESSQTQVEGNEPEQFKPCGPEDNCDLNPEFAVICSFIAHFGDKIDLELNIEQLKSSLENQNRLDNRLIELHVKLLKKLRRYFVRDMWEKALIRFAAEYSYEDAYEIERLGYLKARPSIKIQLLRRLLDAQFECDQKFKSSINTCEANELRLVPTGRDIKGNTYWHRTDSEGNFRIFQEQPLDYKSWKAICSKPEELKYLIDELESSTDITKGEPMKDPYNPLPEIFPEFFIKADKVEDVEESIDVRKHVSRPKKGRKAHRSKKGSLLSVVKEEGDEVPVHSVTNNSEPARHDADTNSYVEQDKKSAQLSNPNTMTSIESQVRITLENLINKVASSIDYIKWPLNLLKTDQQKYDTTEKRLEHMKEKSGARARKRQPKKEVQKEEVLPRRSSSRIQQLQLKKIAEEEEKVKKKSESASDEKANFVPEPDDDSHSKSVSSKNARQRSCSSEEDSKSGRRKRKRGQTWRRGKGKKKLSWDQDDSDLSSISPPTETSDDDLEEEIEEQLKFDTNNIDDEFACEDEEANNEPVIVKRARTARQSIGTEGCNGDVSSNSISIFEEDKPCGRCDKSNDPEWILLCDMCDEGYHTYCCLPPLMIVPDGDWFCPPCEHKTLVTKLKELFDTITEVLAERERERIKRQRLRQVAPKREAKLPSGELVIEKRPRDVLGQLNDSVALQALDDEIGYSSAEVSCGSSQRRSRSRIRKRSNTNYKKKNRTNREDRERDEFRVDYRKTKRTYSRRTIESNSDDSESQSEVSEGSEVETKPKTRRARNCVSYRFQEYDELIQSAIQAEVGDMPQRQLTLDDGDDEEDSEPQGVNYGRGKDMATIEALAYQQENGLIDKSIEKPIDSDEANKRVTKRKARRLNDLDDSGTEAADSDESFQASSATEVDEDDDDITEDDSDSTSLDEIVYSKRSTSRARRRRKGKRGKRRSSYESDESDYKPRSSRRAAARQVSYRESTDEEDDEIIKKEAITTKRKRDILNSDSGDSDASWKSPARVIEDEDDQSTTSCAGSPETSKEGLEKASAQTSSPEPSDPSERLKAEPMTESNKVQVIVNKPELVMKTTVNHDQQELPAPDLGSISKPASAMRNPIAADLMAISRIQHGSSIVTSITPGVRDPIQELNQYCDESSKDPTTMSNPYEAALSRHPNQSDSPPPIPFYPKNDKQPTSSSTRQKKSKKQRPTSSTPPLQSNELPLGIRPASPKDKRVSQPVNSNTSAPFSTSDKPPVSAQRFDPTLPPRQTRPLAPTPRYRASQPIQPQIYPIPPGSLAPIGSYGRGPYPNKYANPPLPQTSVGNRHNPPSNLMTVPYPATQSPYAASIPSMMVPHLPRASIPMNPYTNSQQLWSPVSISSSQGPLASRSRQPLPNMFYSTPGSHAIPNPNFSINQLLGSSYQQLSSSVHSQAPMAGHPSQMSVAASSVGSQPLTSLSQGSTIDSSSVDSRVSSIATDKDTIRGMSDVISFIGDT